MSVQAAAKFFAENETMIGAHGDAAAYNLNAGLLRLVRELDQEIQQLHAELAALSRQVAALQR